MAELSQNLAELSVGRIGIGRTVCRPSESTVLQGPLIDKNLEKALQKLEASRPERGSRWTALDGIQTTIKAHTFCDEEVLRVSRRSWMKKCPRASIATCVNTAVSSNLMSGKSAISCSFGEALSLG